MVRTGGENVADERLAFGRAVLGRLERPLKCGVEVGLQLLLGLATGKHAVCGAIAAGKTVEVQGRQIRLGLDPAGRGGTLDPAGALGTADGDAGALQVGATDPVAGFRNTGLGSGDEVGKRLLGLAFVDEGGGAAQPLLR